MTPSKPRKKWLLELNFNIVVRWKLPALEMFSQFAKHAEVQRG
jgi:hypothetical protein